MTVDPAAKAGLLRSRAEADDLWVTAEGSSMGARYRPGARLLIRPRERPPRLGEVWAFCTPHGEVVAHRFFTRNHAGRYVFRGDSMAAADDPIRTEWLVGIVAAVHDDERTWRPRRSHAVRPILRATVHLLREASRRA